MKDIVELLQKNNKTISTMESCTGGALASAITDIEGSSLVLKFSAVTYSNEFKIKMGVKKEVIDKYSVYSMETAKEMSRNITIFTNSSYGVGITGKINREDEANKFGSNNKVFISIYDKDDNNYYNYEYEVENESRHKNKELIVEFIIKKLHDIIK